MAGANRMSDEWQTEAFRMSMVKKLEEAIQEHGLQGQKDPQQMENQIFARARTREDYLNCIARFILMIKNQRNAAAVQPGNPSVTVQSVQAGSVPGSVVVGPGGISNPIQQQDQGNTGTVYEHLKLLL